MTLGHLIFCILITSFGILINGLGAEKFEQLEGTFTGPLHFDYLTSSTLVLSQRTSLFLVELKTGAITPLIGSVTAGGYVDGKGRDVRFGLITDLAVQGNYMYIADDSCIRVYDIERKLAATLAGICGRMEESQTSSVAPETFKGPLKIAVSARDLYVLDGESVYRVDKETGVSWSLSIGEKLSEGSPTGIEIDKYTNTLFVTVAKTSQIDVVAIDIANGKQSLYTSIKTDSSEDTEELTAVMASLDVAPDGTIYVLEPTSLHAVDRKTKNITNIELEDYGYHEVVASTEYLILSQEYYSRMYKIHVMSLPRDQQTSMTKDWTNQKVQVKAATGKTQSYTPTKIFESQAFYLVIIVPSALFLLVIIVIICAARKVINSRTDRKHLRPASETSSEKYFLNNEGAQNQDSGYWM